MSHRRRRKKKQHAKKFYSMTSILDCIWCDASDENPFYKNRDWDRFVVVYSKKKTFICKSKHETSMNNQVAVGIKAVKKMSFHA